MSVWILGHYSTEEKPRKKRPRAFGGASVAEQKRVFLADDDSHLLQGADMDDLGRFIVLGQVLVIAGARSPVAATDTAVRLSIDHRRLPPYGDAAVCAFMHFR